MQSATLVLRDIHQPPAPSWWPPAPGWWLVAAAVLIAVFALAWFATRRRRKLREIVAVFDDALESAETPPQQVAAMSELLRRAGRRRDPAADRLQGEAWLEFLDDARPAGPKKKARTALQEPAPELHPFSRGPGRLLLEGGYRREIDPTQVAELRPLVRARYLKWMGRR
ncbi:MAG: DUF4381 domain-containing protein [Pseudomonadota bacterium]|nr:DUF4381 domain-containing protein [Pseudomonadota bacterium]